MQRLNILSCQAVEIRPGATAVIDGWGGPALKARVTRVEPSATAKVSALGIEEQRVKVLLDFAGSPAPPELGDGFRVAVHITVWEGKDLVPVPVASATAATGPSIVTTTAARPSREFRLAIATKVSPK